MATKIALHIHTPKHILLIDVWWGWWVCACGRRWVVRPSWSIERRNPLRRCGRITSVCLCICLSICLSACRSVYMSVCLYVCLYVSLHVAVCLSACLSLSIRLPVCLYVCQPMYLSICLSICLSACLSAVYLSVHFLFFISGDIQSLYYNYIWGL